MMMQYSPKDAWFAALLPFRKWCEARRHLWTTVRVAGVVMQTPAGWLARRLLISLEERRFTPTIVRTDNAIVFEQHLPITSLPPLLLGIARGELSKDIDLGLTARLFTAGRPNINGQELLGKSGVLPRGMSTLPHYQLEFRGVLRGIESPFTSEVLDRCDREMLAAGRGHLHELAHALGIVETRDELRQPQDDCQCRVLACIPARIVDVAQTADREAVVVHTTIRSDLLSRTTLHMTALEPGWRQPVSRSPAADGCTTFALPGTTDVLFTLLVDGHVVQTKKHEPSPKLRARVRYASVSAFEGTPSLIKEGLFQDRDNLEASSFERAVVQLFSLCGYTGLGDHRKAATRDHLKTGH